MIAGIGVDLATVSRFRATLERFPERFPQRILSASELAEFASTASKARFLAKRFAVKEAAAKALGTGERDGVLLRDFSLRHDALGKPVLEVHGVAKHRCASLGIERFHVSLSDERDTVVAFVIFERDP